MSCNKKRSIFKTIFILAGIAGIGAVGFNYYKKSTMSTPKDIDIDLFQEELTEILETDCDFIYKLIHKDSEIIKAGAFNSIFDLESLKILQNLYYKSKSFKFEETKALAKNIYIYNIKRIEGYLGKLSEDEVEKASIKLKKTIEKVVRISTVNNLEDLYENYNISDSLYYAHAAIDYKLSKNCSFTRYIVKHSDYM